MPPAAIVSILHRISGAALFLALPMLLWMFDLSLISETNLRAPARCLRLRLVVKLVLLFLVWAFLHHFVAGIRYLVLDLHVGLELAQARKNRARGLRHQPAADAGGGAETVRSILMAFATPPAGIGTRRLVVGAHFGVGSFLLQRLTALILVVFFAVLGVRLLLPGPRLRCMGVDLRSDVDEGADAGRDGRAAVPRVDRRGGHLDGLREAGRGCA